jgi:hypothetical protein
LTLHQCGNADSGIVHLFREPLGRELSLCGRFVALQRRSHVDGFWFVTKRLCEACARRSGAARITVKKKIDGERVTKLCTVDEMFDELARLQCEPNQPTEILATYDGPHDAVTTSGANQ